VGTESGSTDVISLPPPRVQSPAESWPAKASSGDPGSRAAGGAVSSQSCGADGYAEF
jgi:hypothetical protein